MIQFILVYASVLNSMWDTKLPTKYSQLTRDERRLVKAAYVDLQSGNCYHCGASLKGEPTEKVQSMKVKPHLYPKGFFDNPIHLHHNHVTDLTIGAVHARCNAVLWEYFGE